MRPPGANVLRYYAYKATKASELYRPVMYLYFLAQGLDFTAIATLEAAYNVTTVVGEVPTGYVGDRVGRRNSLLLGTLLITTTLVGIGLADSFPALLALYVLWSLGYTFRSGSEDAWLYDTLTVELSADRFASVRGRGESVALLVGAAGSVAGGYLAGFDLAWPFFVAAAITAVGVPVLLTMPEPDATDGVDVLTPRRALRVVREAVTDRRLRAFVVYYYVLFAAVLYLVFIYLQPVFEGVVVDLGVARAQVESLLGWYYAAISLVGAGLSYLAGPIEDRLGLRAWFYALPLVVGGALVGSYLVPAFALVALLFARGIADTTRALASTYVNDRVGSAGRATVLSAMSLVSALAVVPFQLASGYLSDVVSPLFALAAAGVALVVGSLLVVAWERPVAPLD